MAFFKRTKVLLAALIILGLSALLYLTNIMPAFEPCLPFHSYFGSDTVSFPILGKEGKLKFGGMLYNDSPPYFLFTNRNDTLIRLHFRAGYDEDRFTRTGKDTASKWVNDRYIVNYDAKGIYGYSFKFSSDVFEKTLESLNKSYEKKANKKESLDHKKEYHYWNIGPCHHLIVFVENPYEQNSKVLNQRPQTNVMFLYNLSEKEISDMVEADGAIRNESIKF